MSGFRMIGTCVDAQESRVAFRVAASAVLIVLSMCQSAGAAHAANPVSSHVATASASNAARAATSAGSDGRTGARVLTYDDSASATPGGAAMTERELRQMLYAAAEAAVDVSPQVRRLYAEYQAAQSDVDQAKGGTLAAIAVERPDT